MEALATYIGAPRPAQTRRVRNTSMGRSIGPARGVHLPRTSLVGTGPCNPQQQEMFSMHRRLCIVSVLLVIVCASAYAAESLGLVPPPPTAIAKWDANGNVLFFVFGILTQDNPA